MKNTKILKLNGLITSSHEKYNKEYYFHTKYTKKFQQLKINPEYWDVDISINIHSEKSDVTIAIDILSWSNDEQRLVDIDKSWFIENENTRYVLCSIRRDYRAYINNFFSYFKNRIVNCDELDRFIEDVENLKIKFHQKYLNLFSERTLNRIYHYNCKDIKMWAHLDIESFKEYSHAFTDTYKEAFSPLHIEGMYIDGIEFVTDNNDSDLPTIDCCVTGKELTPVEFLNQLNIDQE